MACALHCATGSRIAIRYHEDNPPALAVNARDVWRGHQSDDRQGRVPLVLELLSPAQRPLQITRDFERLLERSVP
ncbi:ATP-dependent helicase C-terminal domain-containing protein [Escherichia coli]